MSDGWMLFLGGALAVLAYLLISNTIWLLIGSRVLQSMPGIDIPGVRGTLRIAIMLLLSFLGLVSWMIKKSWNFALRQEQQTNLTDEVAAYIRRGARAFCRSE